MMKRDGSKQLKMTFLTLEELMPESHFLRNLEQCVDFSFIYDIVEPLYAKVGRPSVEAVIRLSKGEFTLKKVRVPFSLEDMDLSKLKKGATYQEIKDYVKEQTGLNVTPLYIAQVKQKCGIIERECYNKPKSENTKHPQCPLEKEKAIRDALKHFQMI